MECAIEPFCKGPSCENLCEGDSLIWSRGESKLSVKIIIQLGTGEAVSNGGISIIAVIHDICAKSFPPKSGCNPQVSFENCGRSNFLAESKFHWNSD